eukprot:2565919-Alexandrium_andersonii.AAC.1
MKPASAGVTQCTRICSPRARGELGDSAHKSACDSLRENGPQEHACCLGTARRATIEGGS